MILVVFVHLSLRPAARLTGPGTVVMGSIAQIYAEEALSLMPNASTVIAHSANDQEARLGLTENNTVLVDVTTPGSKQKPTETRTILTGSTASRILGRRTVESMGGGVLLFMNVMTTPARYVVSVEATFALITSRQ